MEDCMYCLKDERLSRLMVPVCEFENSILYLYRENSYPGRCILVPKRHLRTMTQLETGERAEVFETAARVAKALEALWQPDQINYLMLGDLSPHVHLHIVPKYRDGKDFGTIFQMMPADGEIMDDAQCAPVCAKLREALGMPCAAKDIPG